MATAGHVWRATRLNTRRNTTRQSVAAVLRSEKLRSAALTAASFGVAPAHDFIGAGAVPRSQRVVAFDDAVIVHYLPPMSSFDDETNDGDGGEEGICRTCHAPVEEERRRWKVGLGLGFVRQVDELDSVRGVCRCDRKRYPEYGMEGDEVIVEEELSGGDFSDTDEDDVLSNFAKASRSLFPKPAANSDKMNQKDEKNAKQRFTNTNNRYSIYELADNVDDGFSSESDCAADTHAPRLLIPRPRSSGEARQAPSTRPPMPRPSSSSTAPLLSDHEEEHLPTSTVAQLKLPPSPGTAPIRRSLRPVATRPMSDPVTSAQRRLRTLPPPCRRPAQRLSGSDALPPPVRTSSMSESVDGVGTPEKSAAPPMSGGEAALARIATAARSDKHLSQLTPSQGSPGEAAAAICARSDGADFTLPPPAAGLPGQNRPREGSACSQRSQRSTTRVLSVLAAEQALHTPPSPEVAAQAHPVRWIPRSNRSSGLSAATAPGDVVLGADDVAPGRLRFRSRRSRTAEIAGDRPLPTQGNAGADEVQVPWMQQTDPQARRRRPDAAPRERSFAGFNRETSLVSATGFEERREEFGASARPYMPRMSKTDLGHLGHIAPTISERRAQMMAREPVTPSRGKMASLRGLRVKMSRMMRSAKGGVPPPPPQQPPAKESGTGETSRPAGATDSPKKGGKMEKSAAKPPRDKVQKQLRLVVEKNVAKGEKNAGKTKAPTAVARDKMQKEKVQKQLRLVVERNQKSNKQSRAEKGTTKEKTKEQNGRKEGNTEAASYV